MVNDTWPGLSLPAAVHCTVAGATPDVCVAGRRVRDTRLRALRSCATVGCWRGAPLRTAGARCRPCPAGTDIAAIFGAVGPTSGSIGRPAVKGTEQWIEAGGLA